MRPSCRDRRLQNAIRVCTSVKDTVIQNEAEVYYYYLLNSFTMTLSPTVISQLEPQAPQAQCEHGRQKYKDLYGNPDKKLKKRII